MSLETSVPAHQKLQRHNSEDLNHQHHSYENLISHKSGCRSIALKCVKTVIERGRDVIKLKIKIYAFQRVRHKVLKPCGGWRTTSPSLIVGINGV